MPPMFPPPGASQREMVAEERLQGRQDREGSGWTQAILKDALEKMQG